MVSCIHTVMKAYTPKLVRAFPAPTPSALPRKTLVSTAVEVLRQRIIDGDFQAGDSLNQVTIAREFAISRIPLREAMRQLEAEGLLLFQPGKGAVVSGLSMNELGEVIELRAMIEPDILGKAIPRLTTGDLEQAKRILDEYESSTQEKEIANLGRVQLALPFHAVRSQRMFHCDGDIARPPSSQ